MEILNIKDGIVNIRGCRLHYEIIENVLPFDTLFIHGNLASNRWWYPALGAWKGKNSVLPRRAILAEWRGCGKSDAPYSDDDLEMSHLANDYADLLKTLD